MRISDWSSDVCSSDLAAPSSQQTFVVKRILHIDGPFEHGDYVWDDKGVPDGPVVITIDLAAQTLSVFRAGYEIGAAVILYGADDKRSEEHTSELQSLMRISYAVFCLKKKKQKKSQKQKNNKQLKQHIEYKIRT